ncbi:glycoside hydrolase family 65 [Paenibacillus sp. 1P07SE]|uniref:glycoside hydrolase family 65 n=1 Tax=Paenibacillus sp. 1P07SE TaxID=3132209 RepID=UPI0039A5EDDE
MNRRTIITRNHPVLTRLEPMSPLSVGNGEFAFSADFTGLQSYPERYEVPLGTQSNWGWHYTGGHRKYDDDDIEYQSFETYGRQVGYPMRPGAKEEAYHWLRQNPHRLQLGRLSLRLLGSGGGELASEEVRPLHQELDLWTGVLHSRFLAGEVEVEVTTACHPSEDTLAVRVVSPLVAQGRLQLYLRFPAPDMLHRSWSQSVEADWEHDERHRSELLETAERGALLQRTMDEDAYQVRWQWDSGSLARTGTHEFTLVPAAGAASVESVLAFGSAAHRPAAPEAVVRASGDDWERFWLSGAAIDFAGSADPRAAELERRVVLSQYLCAIHSSGSMPPQETGLMYNSWFGKMHLEMHWWHAVHFPLWGRAELLMRSMDWYLDILPKARALAASQGYEGARWPKMVGPDGTQTPSPVAPGLIWQQPHPMALAELCYLADPTDELLERFAPIVFEAADFMVSYAQYEEERGAYVLGPPLIPAQECHALEESINPPYELEYWKYGLEIAIRWAERVGRAVDPRWREVAGRMSALPQADGVYLAHERCADTYTEKNHDHPSMVGALGLLPGSLVDKTVMKNTLLKVKDCWEWDSAWGWDFPMCAMTAARLGEPELAVDFLLLDAKKNTYLPNGHNYQRPGLSAYLPGNGGLLAAVAMMAAGWVEPGEAARPDSTGTGGSAGARESKAAVNQAAAQGAACQGGPGFPQDGWAVRWEGLKPWL